MARFLSDPTLRRKIGPYIESWMFGKTAVTAYLSVVCNPSSLQRTIDPGVAAAKIKQAYPNLSQQDWQVIVDLFRCGPVPEADFSDAMEVAEKFIKGQFMARASLHWTE